MIDTLGTDTTNWRDSDNRVDIYTFSILKYEPRIIHEYTIVTTIVTTVGTITVGTPSVSNVSVRGNPDTGVLIRSLRPWSSEGSR